MRPKTTRSQIYQTISSAFSRRSTNSPESPPFQDTSTHLSESPTARIASTSASLSSRSQRIYRSISSAFSMVATQHLQRKQILNKICLHLRRQCHFRACGSKSDEHLITDLLLIFSKDLHPVLADLWKHMKEVLMES